MIHTLRNALNFRNQAFKQLKSVWGGDNVQPQWENIDFLSAHILERLTSVGDGFALILLSAVASDSSS